MLSIEKQNKKKGYSLENSNVLPQEHQPSNGVVNWGYFFKKKKY